MKISELERNTIKPHQVVTTGSRPRRPPEWHLGSWDVFQRESAGTIYADVFDHNRKILESIFVTQRWADEEFYWPVPGIISRTVEVNKAYQGQAIALSFYRELIVNHGTNIYTNYSQSVGARKMWARLNQDAAINVYVLDGTHKKVYKPTVINSELALGNQDIYSEATFSLCAVARGNPADNQLKSLMKKQGNT